MQVSRLRLGPSLELFSVFLREESVQNNILPAAKSFRPEELLV